MDDPAPASSSVHASPIIFVVIFVVLVIVAVLVVRAQQRAAAKRQADMIKLWNSDPRAAEAMARERMLQDSLNAQVQEKQAEAAVAANATDALAGTLETLSRPAPAATAVASPPNTSTMPFGSSNSMFQLQSSPAQSDFAVFGSGVQSVVGRGEY